MTDGTVKQFLDALDEMSKIYPFEADKTYMSTKDMKTLMNRALTIRTQDEKTGIYIEMHKRFEDEV